MNLFEASMSIIGFVGQLLLVLWVLSLPVAIIGVGAGFVGAFPSETTHSYDVKAQQVFDGDRVQDSDVTPFESLSEDEQEILYEAFKKSDHFMGSSEVTVNTGTEEFDTFNDWRTVESNGVLLLVAINEQTEEYPSVNKFKWYHNLMIGSVFYFLVGLLFVMMIPPVDRNY